MEYDEFVEEINILLTEAYNLFNLEKRDRNPKFREWRQSAHDLILRARKLKYDPNTDLNNRSFDIRMGYGNDPSPRECMDAYNRDIQDTINEFKTIVNNYRKYGVPKEITNQSKEGVQVPEKITLKWLMEHVPIKLWGSLVSIILTSFAIGVYVAQTPLYNKTVSSFDEDAKSISQKHINYLKELQYDKAVALIKAKDEAYQLEKEQLHKSILMVGGGKLDFDDFNSKYMCLKLKSK
jgi:hypothetical protein